MIYIKADPFTIEGIQMGKTKFTTIAVSRDVHDSLRKLGYAGESYNDVLKKLLQLNAESSVNRTSE